MSAPIMPAATTFSYDVMSTDTAAKLRRQAARIREQVKTTTTAIIGIGRDLTAVKQNLEHGKFCEWVQAECGFTVRTAENYIRAASFAEGKSETVSLLQPATVYKLAAKNAPPEIVQAVISRAASGTIIADCDVKAMLTEAAFARRQAHRQEARQQVSKRSRQRREDRERASRELARELEESAKVAALDIINTIGVKAALVVLSAMKGGKWFAIQRQLEAELKSTAAEMMQ